METKTPITPDASAEQSRRIADAISRTPGDVLWTALFGFGPSDPMFRDTDGNDSARTVAKLLAVAGVDGFPVLGQTGERCWALPKRLDGAAVAHASSVLNRAMDLLAADDIAVRHRDAEDDRSAFEIAGQSQSMEVSDDALTDCLRTLLELPSWWTAPLAPITLANRPSDAHWRIAVSGMDLDLLSWRAAKAVEESLVRSAGDPLQLLDTPSGRGFQAALGPAPAGYVRRIRMAARDPYFVRSAASWLAVAGRDAFAALGTPHFDSRRWLWSGRRRNGLTAALLRLSGSGLGAMAERVVIAGPFEPNGAAATISFQRVTVGGVRDPLNTFMTAAIAGEMT